MNDATAGLDVAPVLADLVALEVLPGTGVEPEALWRGLAETTAELGPRLRDLLRRRDDLQRQLDDYHRAHPGRPDPVGYRAFLTEIGYLLPEPAPFEITTSGIDREIADQPGPQLVVPVLNARFALNAANARWGSLYDAFYGTDAIGLGPAPPGSYDDARGAEVIARAREVLDLIAPLAEGSHADSTGYRVEDGRLVVTLADGTLTGPADPTAFAGHRGPPEDPEAVLLRHHGLHAEIQRDPEDPIGAGDPAQVKDVLLESAISTIMDLEDSVAAVDAADKVAAYRNWLGLMRGDLTESVTKAGATFERVLAADRDYLAPDGSSLVLPGRSLLFTRNVGHHMFTDAVRDDAGQPIPEGFLDAFITAAAALHDLDSTEGGNSRTGSVYIVKPKQHGPEEVALTVDLFARVEHTLGLPAGTLKLGIMDEERRTSLNLAACVAAAADRVVFVNTGFLDRTGDEIHTSMAAGPMVAKGEMKRQAFLAGYEDHNVDVALAAGFRGRAQIGKGMWAMPDLMADMLAQKGAHPRAGASTAWVPSPTAATLHALHYHQTDVAAVQDELIREESAGRVRRGIDPILQIPLADPDEVAGWSEEAIRAELEDNAQSILGYVVRWIDQGIGCSKVPDSHDVALMEDRATLRISSQLLANWLAHGVVDREQVIDAMRRMAPMVDRQNAGDPAYRSLLEGAEVEGGGSLALAAAIELVTNGAEEQAGYTEHTLSRFRSAAKAR